jgi:hypothetical protein
MQIGRIRESWSAPVKTLSSLAPTRRASAKDPIRFSGRFWALTDRSEEEQSEGEESWDSCEEELRGTSESKDTSRRPPAVATMKGFIARAEELGALSATVVATHHSRWGEGVEVLAFPPLVLDLGEEDQAAALRGGRGRCERRRPVRCYFVKGSGQVPGDYDCWRRFSKGWGCPSRPGTVGLAGCGTRAQFVCWAARFRS